MGKAKAAEWFLTLFVSRERASAAVGDLMERRAGMWLAVTRIALSSMLHGVLDNPGALTWLAVQACVLELAYAWMGARFQMGRGASHPYFLYGYTVLVWYGLGKWVAHRAPGREMAGAAAFVLLNWTFAALMVFLLVSHRISGHIGWSFEPLCFFIAVVIARRRRMRIPAVSLCWP